MNVGTVRRLGTSTLLVASLVASLAACGSSSHASSTPVTVFDMSADPGKGLPVAKPGHHVVLTSAAVRSALDSLLSAHATLVATLMHEVGAGSSDTTKAVNALAANTRALASSITLIYGTDGGRAFQQLWEQHTQFFIDYAQAERDHNGGAKEEAASELRDYQNDFANFVSTATGGGVPLVTVTNLLHDHVQDLTRYIDADIHGHTDEAGRLLRQAVTHMHVIAKAVSDSIVAQHLKTVRP
jgi:hypothetical protein